MKNILNEDISLPTTCLWSNPCIALQTSSINWPTWRERGIETVKDELVGNNYTAWTDLQKKQP